MPIARRTDDGDDEKRVEHFEDAHIFNPRNTIWIPHSCEHEETGTFTSTETDFEFYDMLSDYELPTPFADHQEQVQEQNDDISASYVQISSPDDCIENAESDDEDSNLVGSQGPTFKPTLQMVGLGIQLKNDEREHKMRKAWLICKNRKAKINILMNEGLSWMTAAMQADMAFEKQATGKGRDPEIAAFLLDFDLDYENASNPAKMNEGIHNGLTSLVSKHEPNEHTRDYWCKISGYTSGEIAKFFVGEDVLTIEEKENADAFHTWWMRLLVAHGLTEDEAMEQLTEFCVWAAKKHKHDI